MPRLLAATALLLSLAVPAHAADEQAVADAALGRQLDATGVKYEVDEDGDYKMTFELDSGRTQLVFALSAVESYGHVKVREIWSPGYKYSTPELDARVANRLLEDSGDVILGAWVRHSKTAMFVVKIPADASPAQLRDALEAAANCADKMEKELTGKDAL